MSPLVLLDLLFLPFVLLKVKANSTFKVTSAIIDYIIETVIVVKYTVRDFRYWVGIDFNHGQISILCFYQRGHKTSTDKLEFNLVSNMKENLFCGSRN